MTKDNEEFVPVKEPTKKARKPKKKAVKKSNGANRELRLKDVELVLLDLTERDWELAKANHLLAQQKLVNLNMQYSQDKAIILAEIKTALEKIDQMAAIRNDKLAEIEARLRGIEPNFSFRKYIQQDDGLMVSEEDIVPPEDLDEMKRGRT